MTQPSFADVAIPVPLRQTFTYRVPADLTLSVGMRVAVPFSGQKLAGFITRLHDEPPERVKRVLAIAGCFESEPVFPDELYRFLARAADYYLHPLGEVLKTAAPALPKEALGALKARGFVGHGGELKGKSMATHTTWRIRCSATRDPTLKLGTRQRAVMALVEERGEVLLNELSKLIANARGAVRTLEQKGQLSCEQIEISADRFFAQALPREQPFAPNQEQQVAIDALSQALETKKGGAFLLHGVTGSGKTEVYLHVVAKALARGEGALVLVPEIALTPQLVARFRARFGERIAVLHSGLSDRERHDAWRALRRSEVRLAIGARSALFAPVPKLSVIVVDEEHDPSFKQEEGFRYHGRDMAILRAHLSAALCILGSATPSVETYYLTQQKRVQLLTLQGRAQRQAMPSVEIVDLGRNPGNGPSGHPLLTGPLHRALEACLARKEQAILFLNRRGFAPSLRCKSCAEVLKCPACSVTLTEHRRAGALRCHYCDFAMPATEACPACGQVALERVGVGTERIEDAIQQSFAGVRVARLDRDTATGRGVEDVLDRMRARELDVLVGTQMVTKGHDLPGVTLVGVLLADQSLMFPDFRASERTFQLLAQVAGRAGRGENKGRVFLQTYQPSHYAVRFALAHDYLGFFREELLTRRELDYAPLSRLVAVRVDAGDEHVARQTIQNLFTHAANSAPVRDKVVTVLGPSPAPIFRIRARYRMRMLLRSGSRAALREVSDILLQAIEHGIAPARAHVDVDPVSML
jgi:primosomal protein N' (replication factor Y)